MINGTFGSSQMNNGLGNNFNNFMGQTGTANNFNNQQNGAMNGMQNIGFVFSPEDKWDKLNWQNIHDLDLEDVRRRNDVETLETYLPNILNSTVDQEEFESLKPEALLKLLEILQMSLQYFDFTQDYLDNFLADTQQENEELEKKIIEDEKYLKKSKKDIEKFKQELEIKKEALHKYKQFVKKRPAYKCHLCSNKYFQSDEYLEAHMRRRHPNHLPISANHPQFGLWQNIVVGQQLQNQQQELMIQKKVLEEKLQKEELVGKIEKIMDRTKDEQIQQQKLLLQRMERLEHQQKLENLAFQQSQQSQQPYQHQQQAPLTQIPQPQYIPQQIQYVPDPNLQNELFSIKNDMRQIMNKLNDVSQPQKFQSNLDGELSPIMNVPTNQKKQITKIPQRKNSKNQVEEEFQDNQNQQETFSQQIQQIKKQQQQQIKAQQQKQNSYHKSNSKLTDEADAEEQQQQNKIPKSKEKIQYDRQNLINSTKNLDTFPPHPQPYIPKINQNQSNNYFAGPLETDQSQDSRDIQKTDEDIPEEVDEVQNQQLINQLKGNQSDRLSLHENSIKLENLSDKQGESYKQEEESNAINILMEEQKNFYEIKKSKNQEQFEDSDKQKVIKSTDQDIKSELKRMNLNQNLDDMNEEQLQNILNKLTIKTQDEEDSDNFDPYKKTPAQQLIANDNKTSSSKDTVKKSSLQNDNQQLGAISESEEFPEPIIGKKSQPIENQVDPPNIQRPPIISSIPQTQTKYSVPQNLIESSSFEDSGQIKFQFDPYSTGNSMMKKKSVEKPQKLFKFESSLDSFEMLEQSQQQQSSQIMQKQDQKSENEFEDFTQKNTATLAKKLYGDDSSSGFI